MAVDRLVLLEPGQVIPLETHQSGDGAITVVEHPRGRFVRLPVPNQRERPRRPELHLLRMILISQELGLDVRERDVVLRVVRHLPHVPSRRRVEDQLVPEEAADPPRRRFDSSAHRSHLGIVRRTPL